MASIANDPGGRRRILFVDADQTRKTIRLGKCDRKTAQSICRHVEALLAAKISAQPVPRDTAAWLASISELLRDKLARFGLVETFSSLPKLAEWCRQYIASRTDLAPRSITRLEHAARLMVQFFGADCHLDRITPADAEAYSRWPGLGRAANTIRRRVGWAKQFLRAAVRARLLAHNPFEGLAANTRPDRSKDHFIDRHTTTKLLEACPDAEWRTILSLARFGGLRCPSEVLALEWGHVLWDRDKLTVPCVKTASVTGEAYRVVPLFPEVRTALEELFTLTPEGSRHVITRYRSAEQNLRTQFGRICRKAGVPVPPKPFINLRASRATELVEEFPSHVCAAWLGHSEQIADAHYRQVHDQHYARAVTPKEKAEREAQKAAQQMAANDCNDRKLVTDSQAEIPNNSSSCADLPFCATCCKRCEIHPIGFEPIYESSENNASSVLSGAESGALEPEHAELSYLWSILSADQRCEVLQQARRLAEGGST